MPGQVKKELKGKLKEVAIWPAFLQRRDQLKEEGFPYQQATETAFSRVVT